RGAGGARLRRRADRALPRGRDAEVVAAHRRARLEPRPGSPPARPRRHLHPRRPRRLPVDGADDGGARAGGRRQRDRPGHPAARVAGVTEAWRVGGAQAVAALAYGTRTIRRVDKIVGPGNIYVALAKTRVFGVVGIDMMAGPSEVVVVADAAAEPDWIAADLLAQAEHDPMARAVLITD